MTTIVCVVNHLHPPPVSVLSTVISHSSTMSMQPKASIRRSDQAREAAEILINNSITSDYPPPSAFPRHQQTPNTSMITGSLHNSLVNDGDFLHEAVIAGSTTNGRMSAVRRFFCLFVTFDLMFTTLLWIICFVVGF